MGSIPIGSRLWVAIGSNYQYTSNNLKSRYLMIAFDIYIFDRQRKHHTSILFPVLPPDCLPVASRDHSCSGNDNYKPCFLLPVGLLSKDRERLLPTMWIHLEYHFARTYIARSPSSISRESTMRRLATIVHCDDGETEVQRLVYRNPRRLACILKNRYRCNCLPELSHGSR